MKVAMLITSYYPDIGGHEMFAREMAKYLVQRGHQVDVITGSLVDFPPEVTEEYRIGQFEIIDGVRIFRVSRSGFPQAFFFKMLRQLLKLDREQNYDLIHSVGENIPALVGTVAKLMRRRPHLITVQGGMLQFGFQPGLRQAMYRLVFGWGMGRADWVHTISEHLANGARNLGAKRISVIPNGIDQSLFYPRDKLEMRKRLGLSPEERVVICVGRLTARKRIPSLIQAAALVAAEIEDLRVISIGDGAMRGEIEKLITDLGVSNVVELKGYLDSNTVAEYLGAADVFALPAEFEGLGVVFIEALACGLPVVGCTTCNGMLDVIEDGRTGILVPVGDAEAIAQAIKRLLQDDELWQKFREEGLKRVRERFLWENVLPQVGEIYTRLVPVGFKNLKS